MGSKRKKKKQSQTIYKESNNDEQKSLNDPQRINESVSILNSSNDEETKLPPLEELSNTSFKILPIEMSSPNTTSFTSIHYCYFKSHESRSNNSSINILPPDKTLFISNLPIDSTEAHIKYLFQDLGWLRDYRLHRPVQIKLQEAVDEYIVNFEEAELERRKDLEAKLNQPDEDGFITVTRVGRRNVNTDGTITVTAAKAEEIKNLKPKNKELTDFYRFQMQLIDLRKKFEEDKEKIAKLKASRRFKPY
ncbi:7224_t:CDS:2 [Funneliformis mosseae]|uniref:7224_t:CDS:1 n=1 Tax=Funneliformis mosseae TaxID=27381 RepID=A0A9N9FJV9_FUNMO|nr:7224_t:CDS:2 [Funneliformis mosseae]